MHSQSRVRARWSSSVDCYNCFHGFLCVFFLKEFLQNRNNKDFTHQNWDMQIDFLDRVHLQGLFSIIYSLFICKLIPLKWLSLMEFMIYSFDSGEGVWFFFMWLVLTWLIKLWQSLKFGYKLKKVGPMVRMFYKFFN